MTVLYVNADWSAIVPAGSAEARYGISPDEARRRGLKIPPTVDPETGAKVAPRPADKAMRKPRTK
jgi:hypothetical protein